MNTSRRTVILAEGVLLYARYQDTTVASNLYEEQWARWQDKNGKAMSDIVKKMQYDMFDRVNAINYV